MNFKTKYQRIAGVLGEGIKTGAIPDGTIILGKDVEEIFGVKGETITNALRILKSEGLVELRKVEGAEGNRGRRHVVKSPENLHGGSPERR